MSMFYPVRGVTLMTSACSWTYVKRRCFRIGLICDFGPWLRERRRVQARTCPHSRAGRGRQRGERRPQRVDGHAVVRGTFPPRCRAQQTVAGILCWPSLVAGRRSSLGRWSVVRRPSVVVAPRSSLSSSFFVCHTAVCRRSSVLVGGSRSASLPVVRPRSSSVVGYPSGSAPSPPEKATVE